MNFLEGVSVGRAKTAAIQEEQDQKAKKVEELGSLLVRLQQNAKHV